MVIVMYVLTDDNIEDQLERNRNIHLGDNCKTQNHKCKRSSKVGMVTAVKKIAVLVASIPRNSFSPFSPELTKLPKVCYGTKQFVVL